MIPSLPEMQLAITDYLTVHVATAYLNVERSVAIDSILAVSLESKSISQADMFVRSKGAQGLFSLYLTRKSSTKQRSQCFLGRGANTALVHVRHDPEFSR
jgi:hypothetical protein